MSEETSGRDGQVQITVILSEGWVGPRGAKDLRVDRGSAPGFVRRSFAPTPAPTLSLRMTVGAVWALHKRAEHCTRLTPGGLWEPRGGGGCGLQVLRVRRRRTVW